MGIFQFFERHIFKKLNNKGFSILEMLLAVALFSMFLGGFLLSYLQGQQTSAFGGQHSRATFLAEEGLEAIRNLRDESFANLLNGSHGLDSSAYEWVLSEEPDSIDDYFTREIQINEIDPYRKEIVSTVTWQKTPSITGKVQLTTHLTDWSGNMPRLSLQSQD